MKPANFIAEQTPLPVTPTSSPIPLQAGSFISIQTSSRVSQKWPFAVGAMIAITIVTSGLFLRSEVLRASASLASPNESAYPQKNLPAQPATSKISGVPAGSAFGHLSYAEDDLSQLTEVEPYARGDYQRVESLDYEAAQAFTDMQRVARSQGIELMAISGYRSIADQKDLFASQIQRKGSEAAAAEYSAPPGHSEHHTGYAVDIADASQPDTDLKHSFENTPAYQWLLDNAYMYGFEQSFPKNNAQGVSFEPWHWRYINSQPAKKTFAAARTAFPSK